VCRPGKGATGGPGSRVPPTWLFFAQAGVQGTPRLRIGTRHQTARKSSCTLGHPLRAHIPSHALRAAAGTPRRRSGAWTEPMALAAPPRRPQGLRARRVAGRAVQSRRRIPKGRLQMGMTGRRRRPSSCRRCRHFLSTARSWGVASWTHSRRCRCAPGRRAARLHGSHMLRTAGGQHAHTPAVRHAALWPRHGLTAQHVFPVPTLASSCAPITPVAPQPFATSPPHAPQASLVMDSTLWQRGLLATPCVVSSSRAHPATLEPNAAFSLQCRIPGAGGARGSKQLKCSRLPMVPAAVWQQQPPAASPRADATLSLRRKHGPAARLESPRVLPARRQPPLPPPRSPTCCTPCCG
jgi:hypothetical protein